MRLTSGHCPRKCDLCDSETAKRGAADGVEVKKKKGAKLQRVIVDIILDHDLQPQPKMVEDIRQHQYHRHRDQRRSEEHTSELQSLMRNSYAVFYLQKKHPQTDSRQHHIIT